MYGTDQCQARKVRKMLSSDIYRWHSCIIVRIFVIIDCFPYLFFRLLQHVCNHGMSACLHFVLLWFHIIHNQVGDFIYLFITIWGNLIIYAIFSVGVTSCLECSCHFCTTSSQQHGSWTWDQGSWATCGAFLLCGAACGGDTWRDSKQLPPWIHVDETSPNRKTNKQIYISVACQN